MASTMSRSLSDVPDILYHVFSYLDPIHQLVDDHDQVYESRRSLAVAARTCRGFTVPALDVLWKRLPDDQPLVDLLCALEICERDEHREDLGRNKPGRYRLPNQDVGGYRLPGAAEAYERRWRLSRGYDIRYFLQDLYDPRKHLGWPRFVEYASRVRAITLFALDGPAWCGIWEELQSRTEGAPILPKLLSVAFRRISMQGLTPRALALALISPSVRKLNFNLGGGYAWPALDEKLRCLFSQSFNSAPDIDRLQLELSLSRLGLPLLRTHCSHLRRLEVVPQLDLEGLRLLTELPALQHLSISLSRQNFPEASPSLTLKPVTTLVVEGTWVNLSTFLDTVRLPSMHTLSMTGWAYGEPAAELAKGATQCFRTLASRLTSITSLSVSTTFGRVPPSQGCVVYGIPLVMDTFEASFLDLAHPLLSLSGLRHLSLAFPHYFDIACTVGDLRTVAESFPALEALHLRICSVPLVAPERPRGGPLDALAHFARNCPRLRVLHLPAMEMTDAEGELLHNDVHGREPHGLRTLVVPKVLLPPRRADLAEKVSEVVRRVFPLVASPFRPERLTVLEDWAVADGAWRCPECELGSTASLSTFS